MTAVSLISELRPFAWPIVVLILGVVAIIVLRDPLPRLIGRADVTVEKWGVKAVIGPQKQSQEASPPSQELLGMFDKVLLKDQESLIDSLLDKQGIERGPNRERELLTLLSGAVLVNGFEGTYFRIFGSQLGALQALNSAPSGLPTETLRPWFDLGAAMSPEVYTNYSFEQWLTFLQTSVLIVRNGGMIQITVRGRSFLKYLVHQGYPLTKSA